MVGPMILTGAFGARHDRAVIHRLVIVPALIGGFLWLFAPTPSMPPQGISDLYVNTFYPYMIVPGTVVGGVVAILSVKLRSERPQV